MTIYVIHCRILLTRTENTETEKCYFLGDFMTFPLCEEREESRGGGHRAASSSGHRRVAWFCHRARVKSQWTIFSLEDVCYGAMEESEVTGKRVKSQERE